MIIWGSRGLTSTLEQRQFFCPQCNQACVGNLKQVKNFFTLYFIPLIPLNVAGRFVECNSCAGTFGEEILQYDPEAERQENIMRMLRVMVMSALADGIVDDNERGEINSQYQEISGLPLPAQTLDQEIQLAETSGADLNSYVSSFANDLSGHGKALLIKLAFHTMSASADLQPGHQQQLSQLATTLGIQQEQFVALIDSLSNPAHVDPSA